MAELSKRGKIIKSLVTRMNQSSLFLNNYQAELENRDDIDISFRYPAHLNSRMIETENFKMELLTWDETVVSLANVTGQETTSNQKSKYIILHLHGGGYVGAMRKQYKSVAGLYAEVSKGASVLTIDYRVAPKNPYPAALEDARAAYDWILEEGYEAEDIILAGDSAGAGLAMALCHLLQAEHAPMPAGIVAMSPWADLTASGPSYTENREIDPIFGGVRSDLIFNNPYIGDADPKTPTISPLFGDFTGFPPMLIQSGTDEMLLSDSEGVAAKAKAQGVQVRFTVYEGMFHVFQLAGTYMEESRRAWSEVAKFLEVVMKDKMPSET